MANGSTLPPQAYTRDVLSTAFTWLQTQPESIRKMASNPDALVGLYLRAQKFGGTSAEADAPVSSQSFVNDLKHIAEGLRQFETPTPQIQSQAATQTQTRQLVQPPTQTQLPAQPSGTSYQSGFRSGAVMGDETHKTETSKSPLFANPALKTPAQFEESLAARIETAKRNSSLESATVRLQDNGGHEDIELAVESTLIRPMTGRRAAADGLLQLHPETLKILTELRQDLHLSSDVEVINLAVAIAYKTLRNLIT